MCEAHGPQAIEIQKCGSILEIRHGGGYCGRTLEGIEDLDSSSTFFGFLGALR